MKVTKRDGTRVDLDIEKIHEACRWACEGIEDVSVSSLQLASGLKLYNNIKSSDIQETLIRSAADLITEDSPNYQYVASKLLLWSLYKEVYGSLEKYSLTKLIEQNVNLGFYTSELLEWYSPDELDWFDGHIIHDRDYDIPYAGMELMRTKYLIRNRMTSRILETPQMAFMLIAMTFFHKYEKKRRLEYVVNFYNALSQFELSLPTPIMAGMRTPEKQFSSCTLIEADDNLNSIFSTATAIGLYVAKKAGIGIGGGALRGFGSPIRGGQSTHTGVFSFYRLWEAAVQSCNQGGVRKGSGNLNYVGWHQEFKDLIVLKNNKGTPENRINNLDYTVQLSRLFYERLIEGGDITFFSPSDVPGLYEAFFENEDKFQDLYKKYENNKKIRKTSMKALEFFTTLMTERKETGRIYIMNVDHVNSHGSFIPELAPIRMTNLCTEVTLPTKPFENPFDGSGEIALCVLAAINAGKLNDQNKDLIRLADLLVRALDELLDYQEYPVAAGAHGALRRRSLGIGITGFSHWKAKNNIRYNSITSEDYEKIDDFAQAWSYALIRASVEVAKEKGPCDLISHTKYAGGVLPIDTYKKEVDEIVPHKDKQDWGSLRDDLSNYGIRNSTLMAFMPAETSSLISNSTNGIEDPRGPISIKINKDQVSKQVVPEIKKYGRRYDYLWNQNSPIPYLKTMAIFQKYMDQSISVNTSYNPKNFPGDEISMNTLLQDLLTFYKYGGKCLYYFNTNDNAGEEETEEGCDTCVI